WLATLPTSLKLRRGEVKYLLKKTMEPLLPRETLYRPKMGFAVPLASWFRGPLRQRVRSALLGDELASAGIFNRQYIQHLLRKHESGARDYSQPIWSLLMFEAFLRQLGDRSQAVGRERALKTAARAMATPGPRLLVVSHTFPLDAHDVAGLSI